jgi:LysM repeat protein
MQSNRTRQYLLASCTVFLFFAAGCFQSAGGSLEATNVGQGLPTFTPIPTDTPLPTDTPFATDTPEPTEFVLVAFTNTPDPLALLTGTPVALLPDVQEVDPLVLTATALALIQSGQQPDVQQQPTQALQQQPVTDPLALTATALVAGATQTAAFPMTQTALALLGPSPTFTPVASATLAPGTAVPPGTCVHTVSAGENLFRISLQYNTTVEALAAANGIANPNLIFVGQQLTIPGCGSGGAPPSGGGSPGPGEQVYIVQQGDTLFQISLQYGKTVDEIAARNGITNVNLIFIGQTIIIPA